MAELAPLLERILARLEALEAKVDALSGHPLEDAPTEMVGHATSPLVAAGSTRALAPRVSDPVASATLDRLMTKLDKVEAAVDTFGRLAQRVPLLGEALGDSASFAWSQAEARGIDPIAAGLAGLELAARAAQPEMLARASRLIDQAPLLDALLDQRPLLEAALAQAELAHLALAHTSVARKALEQAPQAEALLDAIARLPSEDLRTLTEQGVGLLPKLAALLRSAEFKKLMDSGILEPRTLGVAAQGAAALAETQRGALAPVGAFGAFFKLNDPDVQRAVGFSLSLAKSFGSRLSG